MPLQIALVGAGLHNLLLAHLLSHSNRTPGASTRPLHLVFFDEQKAIDTQKFISCHESDVPSPWRDLLLPLWLRSWPAYRVRFPAPTMANKQGAAQDVASCAQLPFQDVALGYHTLDLERLAAAPRTDSAQGVSVEWRLGTRVCPGELAGFDVVVDSRSDRNQPGPAGVQQFLGQVLRLGKPHGVELPVVMDAAVAQIQGFCFVYLLPLDDTSLLVEATRLLVEPQPWNLFEEALVDYCRAQGWDLSTSVCERSERGLIPIPWVGAKTWRQAGLTQADLGPTRDGPVVFPVGAAHGFFHPTTGYSLPMALRSCLALQEAILGHRDVAPDGLAAAPHQPPPLVHETPRMVRAPWATTTTGPKRHVRLTPYLSFVADHSTFWSAALLFNRFLLWGFSGSEAWNAFRYFYALPPWFIKRFYAGTLRGRDRLILLTRRPPRRFRAHWLLARLSRHLVLRAVHSARALKQDKATPGQTETPVEL